jgi:hypothetical protein
MIWQLMKRDRPWRTGIVLSIVVAFMIVAASIWMDIPARVSSREAFRSGLAIFLSVEAAIVILIGSGVYAARDLYEAALPLDGRDIWLSRLLALLSVAWLPVPIGMIGGLAPLTLLAGASVTTFLLLCGQCYRIREVGTPKWLRDNVLRVILIIPVCAVFFARPLRSVHWPAMPPAWSILIASGLLSVLLFRYGWQSVPRSFSVAPLTFIGSARRETGKRPKLILTPVLRSIYIPRSMLLLFGFVVFFMVKGSFAIGILAAIPLQSIYVRSRWLLALPISRRKLFGLVAAAPTIAVGIGSIATALLGRGHAFAMEERLVDFALDLASVYLALFLFELPDWRSLSKLRWWMKWIPLCVGLFTMPLFNIWNILPLLGRAGVPHWWPMLFLLPAATYWLAEKAFIEQEYPRPLIPTNQSRSLSI